MGLLLDNLKAAGFSPTDFDTVLLTHIHPDHSSGLISPDGKAMFSRAEIVVHEDDVSFWSDPICATVARPPQRPISIPPTRCLALTANSSDPAAGEPSPRASRNCRSPDTPRDTAAIAWIRQAKPW